MALATGAPVIPIAMIDYGEDPAARQGRPQADAPGIRIGKPLDFSRYQGMDGDRFILRSVTDEVMYEIMKLSGRSHVDIYATVAKRQIAEAQKAAKEAAKGVRPGRRATRPPAPDRVRVRRTEWGHMARA